MNAGPKFKLWPHQNSLSTFKTICWWKHQAMWSGTSHQDHTVYMMGDIKMLVEAYVSNFVVINLNGALVTLFKMASFIKGEIPPRQMQLSH